MSVHKSPESDLKHRVITCINKLSDRDTLSVAVNELESITKALTAESFSPFLTCLSTTDSSEKSPVRKQCVRLLGLLSVEHRDALSPHLSKMLSAILHRLKENDSSVRSACVDAVSSMASHITKPPFSTFIKPLVEALLIEQDYNAQIGSALCLAAAIDSSPYPEPAQLQKLLPRFSKLVKNDSFKAKPALLSVIGSIGGAGGASNRNILNSLIPCLIEFLSSEDWSARKAAAETLARLALVEKIRLTAFKSQCLASLESRRFDKVKHVRETMNRAIELWKDVPGDSENGLFLPHSQFNSSRKDISNSKSSPTVSRSSQANNSSVTPQPKKVASNTRSSPSVNSSSSEKKSPLMNSLKKPSSAVTHRVDPRKPSNWTIEVAEPKPPNSRSTCEETVRDEFIEHSNSAVDDHCTDLNPETNHVLFKEYSKEKSNNFAGSRFGSRVVPFHEKDDRQFDIIEENASEDVNMNQKEVENLSVIQKQLLQIENQQSSLLDLLQRYIGSSQSGINNLETRVNGLEKALDEISYDLAVSTGKIHPNQEYSSNTCCMLPGTDFLSPKYWRRTDNNFSTSKYSFTGRNNASTNSGNGEIMPSPRVQNHNGFNHRDSRGNMETFTHRSPRRLFKDGDTSRTPNGSVFNATSFGNRVQH